jgi:hypothetical protein
VGVAVPAAAATSGQGSQAGVASRAAAQVSVDITAVTPWYAQPRSTILVTVVVTNPTAAAASGLWLQLWSSSTPLASRFTMNTYLITRGPTALDQPEGTRGQVFSLAPHTFRRFTLRLRPDQAGIRLFGVYPLAAQLSGPAGPLARDRTFLPFWPGKPESRAVKPVSIAWVWPLIDVPQQTACRALRSNELAASLAAGGRLNGLLAAGSTVTARQARLTWAIDPALLSDTALMTGSYRFGVSATCAGGRARPASAAARAWLARLRSVAASQDFFVTPYADVDVAALAHRGLDSDLASAFNIGRATAAKSKTLRRPQRTSPGLPSDIAWPPGGFADYGVLEDLIHNDVRTVLLNGAEMPPRPQVAYTPSAATTTGVNGTRLHVLLADPTLAQILAAPRAEVPGALPAPAAARAAGTGLAWSPGAAAAAQAATFAREQWFLAETAMIAAELPGTARSVVVMPPRRWNPPAGMATTLLKETGRAPWLRPASLAGLVTARHIQGNVPRKPPPTLRVGTGELRARLLHRVRTLTGQIHLLGSILTAAGPHYLATAAAAVESSAWRGNRASQQQAEQTLHDVAAYVRNLLQQVTIVHTPHVTLGGNSGLVPVSVRNNLPASLGDVRVRLEVKVPTPGRVAIGHYTQVVTVPAGTQNIIKIPVRSVAAGSTALDLRLATPDGRLLPGQAASLTVQATHFGTLAIVIIVVALVVFVFTAAGRAMRRGAEPADEGIEDDITNEPKEPGQGVQTFPAGAHPASRDGGTDTVVTTGADEPDRAKEPDDHARTPGQARRH